MPLPAATSRRLLRGSARSLRWTLLLVPCLAACADRGGEPSGESRADGDAATVAEASTGVDGGSSAAGAGDATAAGATAADAAALAPLLTRADRSAAALSTADRGILEEAMGRLLQPRSSACDGCRTAVVYAGGESAGARFRGDVRGRDGEVVAALDVFHRPDLGPELAKSWARSTLAGHPASGLDGERLFVWAGHFEIRAFGRGEDLRGEHGLEQLVSSLPLDALAKL